MNKKYELTDITTKSHSGHTLYRIRALKDFYLSDGTLVKAKTLGGFVQSEENLSQKGSCWVSGNSIVCDNAKVLDDAVVIGSSVVSDNAIVKEFSQVLSSAVVKDKAVTKGHAKVAGCARIKDNAVIADFAVVYSDATVKDNSIVCGAAIVKDNAAVIANSVVGGHLELSGSTVIAKNGSSVFERIFNQKRYNICLDSFKIFENTKVRIFPIHAPLSFPSSIVEVSDGEEITGITINSKSFVKGVCYCDYFSVLKDCQKKLLEKRMMKFASVVEKKYKCVFMLLNYFQKKTSVYTDSYRLAKSFIQKLIKISDTDKILVINSQKKYITEILSNYILAQFAGIICFGIEMCSTGYVSEFIDNTSDKYLDFLLDFVNRAEINVSDHSINNIEGIDFVYNKEMIYAVERLCDFDSSWEKEIIQNIKKENGFELYLD